jgi:hypothetical protein
MPLPMMAGFPLYGSVLITVGGLETYSLAWAWVAMSLAHKSCAAHAGKRTKPFTLYSGESDNMNTYMRDMVIR